MPAPGHMDRGALEHLRKKEGIGRLCSVFRKQTIGLLGTHCTKDVATMFAGATRGTKGTGRLHRLGITGAWATVQTSPCWPNELWDKVQTALLTQRGLQRSPPDALGQGPWYVRPRALRKEAPPLWRRPPTTDTMTSISTTTADGLASCQNYLAQCQSCKVHTLVLKDKPTADGKEWPRMRCGGCKKQVRLGRAKCMMCQSIVSKCTCTASLKKQVSIKNFFTQAATSSKP